MTSAETAPIKTPGIPPVAVKERGSLDLSLDLVQNPETKALVAQAQRDPAIVQKAEEAFEKIRAAVADPETRETLAAGVRNMGVKAQLDSAKKSGLLNQRVGELAARSESGSEIAKLLVSLKREVQDLDPGQIRTWNMPGILEWTFGWVPFVGPTLQRYMDRFQTAKAILEQIENSLAAGARTLDQDSITLEQDRSDRRAQGKLLAYQATVGLNLREKLLAFLGTLPPDGEERVFVETELVFPLNQRVTDLLTHLNVAQQGVVATKILMDNNHELVNSVNRARTLTMDALGIGVSIAVALTNEEKVMKGVQAANEAAGTIIASNARRLKTQGAAIHKQASSAFIALPKLKQAFQDLNAALDDIETFRRKSLSQMQDNITELSDLTSQTEKRIVRMEKGERVRKIDPTFLELDHAA